MPAAELDDMQVRGGVTLDRQTYYVVDQVVPRKSLGRNVHTLELDVTNSTRVARKRPAAAPAGGKDVTGREFWAMSKTQRVRVRARLMRMPH